jgi:hypothetical protein
MTAVRSGIRCSEGKWRPVLKIRCLYLRMSGHLGLIITEHCDAFSAAILAATREGLK